MTKIKVSEVTAQFSDLKAAKNMKANHVLDRDHCTVLAKHIGKKVAELDIMIHVAAVSAVNHYLQHRGEATLMTLVAKSVAKWNTVTQKWDGRSTRGADLRRWFETVLPEVKWAKKGDKGQGCYKRDDKVKGQAPELADGITLDWLMANPFFEFLKDSSPEVQVISDDDWIESIIKEADTLIDGTVEIEEFELAVSEGREPEKKKRKYKGFDERSAKRAKVIKDMMRQMQAQLDALEESGQQFDSLTELNLTISKAA